MKKAPSYETQELREFGEVLQGRRTINLYLQTPVPGGLVREAIEVATWAEKPGWLIVTCRKSDDELLQREDYAACCTATQNFMLYLWKAGVGSKWVTSDIIRDSRFFEIAGIDPSSEFVVALIFFGYPKLTPTQSRKPVEDVLTDLP